MKAIQAAPGVPPAVALLLNEQFSFFDQVGARKKLRELIPEIRRQTLSLPIRKWYLSSDVSFDPWEYRVFMDGGLDLFVGHGACWNLSCRLSYADQIARSIILMADSVWMQDTFTPEILAGGRLTNIRINSLLDDIRVLQRLRPLIETGIVKFGARSGGTLCLECAGDFYAALGDSIKDVVDEFRKGVRFDFEGDEVGVYSGPMFDPPLYQSLYGEINDRDKDGVAIKLAASAIMSSSWTAKNAAKFGGAVFSNSRIGLSGLLGMSGEFPGLESLRLMEGHRAGALPWVQGLSVEQTLHLREEAGLALPRLREFLARYLAANPTKSGLKPSGEEDYILELREQAAEVGAELRLATSKRPSLARTAKGVAALGLIAYGFAKGSLVSGEQLALLISSLAYLHDVYGHEAPDVDSIKAKPGYVLVAAQDILSHAKD